MTIEMEEVEATYWKVAEVNEPEIPTPYASQSLLLTLAGESKRRTVWGELAMTVEVGDYLQFDEAGNPCAIVKPTS